MSKKVPEGWEKVRLENVSEHVKDKSTSDLIPYIEIGDVVAGAWTYQIKDKSAQGIAIKAKKGDICISTVRPTRRAMIMLKEDSAVSPAFTVLRNKGNSDWSFIFEVIKKQQFYDRLGVLATGSTYPTCSHSDVLLYEFLLPPLPEQRKIADILSSVDNAIEKTKAVIEQTKVVKKALMQELLIRGIPGRHKKFKKTPIRVIPEEWEVVKLKDISGLITSGSRGWAQYYSDDGPIFLRIGNLTRDHINLRLDNLVYVDLPENNVESIRTVAKDGDILISVTADLGIIGVVPSNFEEAYVNQHIALVRIKASNMNPRWVGHFLSSESGQLQFRLLNDAGSKAGLNLNTIASLKIAKPKKDEQDEISRAIDRIDTYIYREQSKLASFNYTKSALMQVLLTGEKRVTI